MVLDEEPTDRVFEDMFYSMLFKGYRPLSHRDRIIAEAKAVFFKTFHRVLYQCNRGTFP